MDTRGYLSETRLARIQLDRIKNALPEAVKFTYLVCHRLCQFAGVSFQYPHITVAAERLSIDEIAASLSTEKLSRNDTGGKQPESGDA